MYLWDFYFYLVLKLKLIIGEMIFTLPKHH